MAPEVWVAGKNEPVEGVPQTACWRYCVAVMPLPDADDFEESLRRGRRFAIGLVTLSVGGLCLSGGIVGLIFLTGQPDMAQRGAGRAFGAMVALAVLGGILTGVGLLTLIRGERGPKPAKTDLDLFE